MSARTMILAAAALAVVAVGFAALPLLLPERQVAGRATTSPSLSPVMAPAKPLDSPNSLFTGSIVPRRDAVRADRGKGTAAGDAEWPFSKPPAAGLYTPQNRGD